MGDFPLLVGWGGFAELVGVHRHSVRAWRSRLDYAMPIRAGLGLMLREDITDGDQLLWYTEGVIGWAVRNELLPAYPTGPLPGRRPVLTIADIADMFGVRDATVRKVWRTNLKVRRRQGAPDPAHAQVLPEPDLVVEGVWLWWPVTIDRWADDCGRRRRP